MKEVGMNLHEALEKIKWWERILLWFRPKIITMDGTYRLVGKELFGKIYIIDEYDIGDML